MEAIERYSAEMRSNDNTIISTTEELERCIDPNELILPGRISPDSKLEWCAALNLRNNKNIMCLQMLFIIHIIPGKILLGYLDLILMD